MTVSHPDLERLQVRLGDRYTIGRQLGRGGMGAVYLARDIQLDRPVAIKVLPSEFASQSDLRERFLRETRTAASFSHPNIVPVFAVEDRGDLLAMAMGYIEGESLAERVKRAGPLTVKECVRLLQDVGYALAYAHGRSVVHRDIKPDNIMIERATGRALVMDFGISRIISTMPAVEVGLTRVGEVIGTPEFMSPEQASGDFVDGRSDLYALGLVAWYAVTGVLAISGETTQKVLVKQLTEAIAPVAEIRADLPVPLADAIDRLLQKDPLHRFQTAEALVESIDAAQLAAPEIPLPVRLFQQNGKSYLVNALLVALFAAMNWWRSAPSAVLDRLATVSVAFALEIVLLISIALQARTLSKLGFDHTALRQGLRAILDEGDDARATGLAVAGVAQKRSRRKFAMMPLMLLGAVSIWFGYTQRVEIDPGHVVMSRVAITIVITGVCSVVVAALVLGVDPYRRPIMQRVANAFWGGAIGAWLMGASSDRQPNNGSAPSVGAAAAGASRAVKRSAEGSSPSSHDQRLSSIEARLALLERTRVERPS